MAETSFATRRKRDEGRGAERRAPSIRTRPRIRQLQAPHAEKGVLSRPGPYPFSLKCLFDRRRPMSITGRDPGALPDFLGQALPFTARSRGNSSRSFVPSRRRRWPLICASVAERRKAGRGAFSEEWATPPARHAWREGADPRTNVPSWPNVRSCPTDGVAAGSCHVTLIMFSFVLYDGASQ